MGNDEFISFIKKVPPITIVGVVGDEGKTTTAYVIYEVLKKVYPPPLEVEEVVTLSDTPSVFWLNASADLESLVKKVKREDIVVVELDEAMIKDFDEAGISVHIVVCTNILPVTHGREVLHVSEQSLIFKRQTSNNFIVIGEDTFSHIKKSISFGIKAKVVFKKAEDIPRDWSLLFKGYHNRENVALALGVAELMKVGEESFKETLVRLAPLAGRLQYVKKIRGIDIYNDASSRTPASTLAALQTVSNNRNVVLVMGGRDIGFNPRFLLPHLNQYCSGIVLLAGTGTLAVHKNILDIATLSHAHAQNLDEAAQKAIDMCRSGDVLLFSPAFGCTSEASRSEEFLQAVENVI